MTESFTEDQVKKIVKKVREEEQWRLSGDIYYRAANAHIESLVRQGVYDLYVLQVGQTLHDAFKEATQLAQPQDQPSPEQPIVKDQN